MKSVSIQAPLFFLLILHCATMFIRPKDDLIIAVKDQNEGEVRRLLSLGQDMENRNNGHDRTALDWAAYNCDPKISRILIDSGANINSQSPLYGDTPLIIAAQMIGFNRKGCFEVAKLLIASGANVNILDKQGIPALYYAVSKTRAYEGLKPENLVKLLIDYGATKTLNAENGLALAAAMCDSTPDIVKLFLSFNIDPTVGKKYVDADCHETNSVMAANPYCEENKKLVADYIKARRGSKP